MNSAKAGELNWTTFGRDLLVSIANVPRGSWTNALCAQVRTAIRSGALRPGVRLPATRSLARDLGLSRGVIVSVYDQLNAEGYLDIQHGSGTRVASIDKQNPDNTNPSSQAKSPQRGPNHRPRNPGLPDPNLFPRNDWLRAYRRGLSRLSDDDLRYGDPQGFEPLRNELADYLGRVRGVQATPNQILITNGYAQGLAVIARVLQSRATPDSLVIAVEEPGSAGTRTQLQAWGANTPPVGVDANGLRVEELRDTHATAVLVTPAHHYPTGVVLSPERRKDLLAWGRDNRGRFIIEDDYDAEFRYDHTPVGSLQPLAPEIVITGSSVSKTLSPALRLGWLVLPHTLVEEVVHTKTMFDLGTAVPNQAAMVELLRSGDFDRHLRRSRVLYRKRRHQLANELIRTLPDVTVSGLDAGLNLCLYLDNIDDSALATELKRLGITCESLSHYFQASPPQTGLVLDLVTTDKAALATITTAIRAAKSAKNR